MMAENQALRLEKLMQKHQCYPEYELCLPSVSVKKAALRKLRKGDLLLLGMSRMDMLLVSKEHGSAKAVLSSCDEGMTIRVMEACRDTAEEFDSKKYKNVKISLGILQSRVLEAGHKIETAQIDMDNILLYAEEKKIASAALVMVDDEIAVQIKEVEKQ